MAFDLNSVFGTRTLAFTTPLALETCAERLEARSELGQNRHNDIFTTRVLLLTRVNRSSPDHFTFYMEYDGVRRKLATLNGTLTHVQEGDTFHTHVQAEAHGDSEGAVLVIMVAVFLLIGFLVIQAGFVGVVISGLLIIVSAVFYGRERDRLVSVVGELLEANTPEKVKNS